MIAPTMPITAAMAASIWAASVQAASFGSAATPGG